VWKFKDILTQLKRSPVGLHLKVEQLSVKYYYSPQHKGDRIAFPNKFTFIDRTGNTIIPPQNKNVLT
jgi:hypothetical protein